MKDPFPPSLLPTVHARCPQSQSPGGFFSPDWQLQRGLWGSAADCVHLTTLPSSSSDPRAEPPPHKSGPPPSHHLNLLNVRGGEGLYVHVHLMGTPNISLPLESKRERKSR